MFPPLSVEAKYPIGVFVLILHTHNNGTAS